MNKNRWIGRLVIGGLILLIISLNGLVFFGFQHSYLWGAGLPQMRAKLLLIFIACLLLQLGAAKWIIGEFHRKKRGGTALPRFSLRILVITCVFYFTSVALQGWMFSSLYDHPFQISIAIWVFNLLLVVLIVVICYGYSVADIWFITQQQHDMTVNEQLSSELRFLKAQIDPHFLFNSLNTLYYFAQSEKNGRLADGIARLSELLRYSIYENNRQTVPLIKEIRYLQDYMDWTRERYAEGEVEVLFEVIGDPDQFQIAPMLLQPLVENAFKHGVRFCVHSLIEIRIEVNSRSFLFVCQNPVHEEVNDSNGIGLENVKRRANLIYGENACLSIHRDQAVFRTELKIHIHDRLHPYR